MSDVSKDARWVFNFADWNPSEELWEFCLSLLPADEVARIKRFKRPIKDGVVVGRHNLDARSSLIGRLMLRKCAHENLRVDAEKQQWRRTLEGKPYLLNMPASHTTYISLSDGCPRAAYNMNVSHDGKCVAFASGKDLVIGVDTMLNTPRDSSPVLEFFSYFEENFTTYEWSVIKAPHDDSKKLQSFYLHWTLKESYIKAIGYAIRPLLIRSLIFASHLIT